MVLVEPKVESKVYWMGEDIETLSREDLLEVTKSLMRSLDSQRSLLRSVLEINELARKIRNKT